MPILAQCLVRSRVIGLLDVGLNRFADGVGVVAGFVHDGFGVARIVFAECEPKLGHKATDERGNPGLDRLGFLNVRPHFL
jgi:hypothetical protein